MQTVTNQFPQFTFSYPLETIAPLNKILFLDIETTGFTARSSYLYMIGCGYFESGIYCTKQWMADAYEEESSILSQFFDFAKKFHFLIHFNGNNFDLPFILQKCELLGIPYNFDSFDGLDLYRRIAPYKMFLKLPDCKQKTIELYLGINRSDLYSGGELISIYHDYVEHNNNRSRSILLLHNKDDLIGMAQIVPILSYYDLLNLPVKAKKVQANYYTDFHGNKRQELIMTLSLPHPLPVSLSSTVNSCYFKGEQDTACLKVPLYEEELKYFYANYKDYYYLPVEDIALHKSVSEFVDKDHRVKATASTCYTRKKSLFLPQWDLFYSPFYKRDYHGKELFFELTDEMKSDRELFSKYANHVLSMMSSTF